MAKSKGIYIDRNTLVERINNICSENWEVYSVSELYEVGNTNRCDIVADGREAILNFYYKADGTTTIQVAGTNTDISQLIKTNMELNAEYKGDVESKTCSFKKLSLEWSDKLIEYFVDNTEIDVQKTEIEKLPKHTEHILTSKYGDRLIINRYENGTLVLQGKPAYIYGEAIAFLSYCNEITVADIVESVSDINKVAVKTDDVNSDLKMLLKNSYDGIDAVILKLLSPSVALRKVSIELDDYSCFAFPALRALEGYIKWMLLQKNVSVGNTFGNIFDGYSLSTHAQGLVGDSNYQSEVERVYRFFKDNRHVHFHTEQILIGTTLIEKRSEADSIVNDVIELIDTSYKNVTL